MPSAWYPSKAFIQSLLDAKKNAPMLKEKDRIDARRRLRAGKKSTKKSRR